MLILTSPLRLRLASLSLLLSIPLASLQSILVSGAPWWDLPYRRAGVVAALAAGLFVPLCLWSISGRRWALSLAGSTGATWFTVSLLNAIHLRTFWVATFVLVLGIYWLISWSWLALEMGRSFLDPRMQWFHGTPEAIPGLDCQWMRHSQSIPFRVCRLDRDGVFVFQGRKEPSEFKKPPKTARTAELELSYKGRRVKCKGSIVSLLEDGGGFGIRFDQTNRDQAKDLGDFVEILRGSGHA